MYIAESPSICISNYEGISMALLEVKMSFGNHDKKISTDVLIKSFAIRTKELRISAKPAHKRGYRDHIFDNRTVYENDGAKQIYNQSTYSGILIGSYL